jgi:iron complex outermembrane recepter protein
MSDTRRPSRFTTRLLLSLALGAVLARPALADPKDDARRHFIAALESVRAKDYPAALDEFFQAQDVYPHPSTLYNIARVYQDMGELEKAVEFYRSFQQSEPTKAADVEPVIKVIEGRIRAAAVAPPTAEPDAGAGGGAATSAELERLRAIADELARLSAALQERSTAPDSGTPGSGTPGSGTPGSGTPGSGTPDTGTPDSGVPPVAATGSELADGGDFLSGAYDRVVVTASRYGQDPLDSPSTVTILTADDIALSGATNVPDVLRRVVGVDVMSLAAGQPDLSIRGFNREMSNKVLILVDGRSVYKDMMNTPLWSTLPVSLHDIERIEVIRGPGSAVYGANAMTGVVNIITRTPGEGDDLVHVEGGGPGYAQGNVVMSGREGGTAYRFSGGYHRTGRWSKAAEPVEDGPLYSGVSDQDTSLDVVRALGRVDHVFNEDLFASMSAGYSGGNSEFYVFGALGNYSLPFSSGFVRGDLGWKGLHLRSFANFFRAEAAPWLQYKNARDLTTSVVDDIVDVELEHKVSFETGAISHSVNAGVGYRYKHTQWGYINNGDPVDQHHANVFGQETANIGPVSLVGSLRVDRHPLVDVKHTISPRGAAVVRVAERTSVRATGGTSFRAPSMMESYTDLNQLTPADGLFIGTKGDETLVPERVLSGELGLHDESTSYHRADVAGYVNRVQDLIYVTDVDVATAHLDDFTDFFEPDEAGFSAGTTRFVNVASEYTAWGVEVDGQVFPVDGLDIFANADIQRIYEESGSTRLVDGATSTVKINGGAAWRTPWRIDASGHVHYVSAQVWRLREFAEDGALVVQEVDVPARTIGVARLAARPFADEKLEIAATAWNIGAMVTGEGFREHPKGQLVSSRLFGTATYRF